jgi:hypothetical protein
MGGFLSGIMKGYVHLVDPGGHKKNEKYIDKVHNNVNKQMPWSRH